MTDIDEEKVARLVALYLRFIVYPGVWRLDKVERSALFIIYMRADENQ